MATLAKSILEHPVWGTVVITRNPRARRIVMRARHDSILMTVPLLATGKDIERALEQCGEKLTQQMLKQKPETIDTSYRIESDNFSFGIAEHEHEKFLLRRNGNRFVLLCPKGTRFNDSDIQEWLRKVIRNTMAKAARAVLPQRLEALARKHGFSYSRCTLRDVHTRWGSCSSRGSINLSIYLMMLPDELVDYVILHELCHTVEMNHSERFWTLLDKAVAPARAKALRARLKGYSTRI